MENKEFLTIAQLAHKLGVSRIAVYKKVKKGQIKAMRIGKNFVIPKSYLKEALTKEQKKQIDAAVKKTVKEYGQTLKLLGRE